MSINLGSIFGDLNNWIKLGSDYAHKSAGAIDTAAPVLSGVFDSVQSLANIGKDLIMKPDPTPEHIAEVDRLRAELVAKANALK